MGDQHQFNFERLLNLYLVPRTDSLGSITYGKPIHFSNHLAETEHHACIVGGRLAKSYL